MSQYTHVDNCRWIIMTMHLRCHRCLTLVWTRSSLRIKEKSYHSFIETMNEELRQNTPSGEKYGIFLLTNNCTFYFNWFIYLITDKDIFILFNSCSGLSFAMSFIKSIHSSAFSGKFPKDCDSAFHAPSCAWLNHITCIDSHSSWRFCCI